MTRKKSGTHFQIAKSGIVQFKRLVRDSNYVSIIVNNCSPFNTVVFSCTSIRTRMIICCWTISNDRRQLSSSSSSAVHACMVIVQQENIRSATLVLPFLLSQITQQPIRSIGTTQHVINQTILSCMVVTRLLYIGRVFDSYRWWWWW